MRHHVVGIDLGTTYSAVAAFDPDLEQAEIILNDKQRGTTPSVVAWNPQSGKVTVGQEAKASIAQDPGNVVIEIKREMGEVFDQERLVKYLATDRFVPGDPLQVQLAGRWWRPQEISAFILMKMKEVAQAELGEPEILDAVITVPAYFRENQRGATKEAALLAGLYPLQLIAEPTAAAICYGLDRFEGRRRAYLVYDLGGGTFDVSIIHVEGERVIVVATSGDQRLGGGDFDDAITDWATGELAAHHGLDIKHDPRARAIVKAHAELSKERLSDFQTTTLSLLELRPAEPPVLTLTRDRFEELIRYDLTRTLHSVEEAIRQASAKGLERNDLDAVLLVGGSTKIPAVRRMLADYFGRGDDFVKLDLDPAAVVARGAAIMASRFSPSPPPFDLGHAPEPGLAVTNPRGVVDVLPITEHTLSVGVVGKRVVPLIERGTAIPVSATQSRFTNEGPSETLEAPVFQGESEYQPDNTRIGTVYLDGLDPRPKGYHQFQVTYSLDENGLLAVEVKEARSGKVWESRFEHETLVNSVSQLEVRRQELLRLYGSTPAAPPPGYAPPAPRSAAEVGTAPATGGPEPGPPVIEHDTPVELDREALPAELRFLVDRVRRQLSRTPEDGKLREAYQAFATAVANGSSEDDVLDLADALDDELHRARTRGR
jgi:molecular chaperone DnaK (HSP70)